MLDPNDEIYGIQHNPTMIQPLGYKVLVELLENREISKYKGTLEIPDDVADRYNNASVAAKVLQLGPDCYRDEVKYPTGPWVRPGQLVILSPYTGTRVRSPLTKSQLRLINDDSMEAIIPDIDLVERSF